MFFKTGCYGADVIITICGGGGNGPDIGYNAPFLNVGFSYVKPNN
jgi:hypothetical protein